MFLITTLLVILFIGDINSLISDAKSYTPEDIEWDWYHGSISDTSTFKSGLALVVAITAAEMFSQGNWQRAWASEDEKSLKKAAITASLIVFPLIFVMGFLGTSVAGQGAVSHSHPNYLLTKDQAIIWHKWAMSLVLQLAVQEGLDG